MIASLVSIPALAYFIMPSRPAKPKSVSDEAVRQVNLDPAAAKRARNEKNEKSENENELRRLHPEHEDPETFRPAFGQIHKQKRVDMPPDGRNHQALHDRARGRAQE